MTTEPPIRFVPKSELNAIQNRSNFESLCRNNLSTFGKHLDFDAAVWNVSDYFASRGHNHELNLRFAHSGRNKYEVGVLFQEPFVRFAKSYIRYLFCETGRTSMPNAEIRTFGLLELALAKCGLGADIGFVDATVLNQAVELARAAHPQNLKKYANQLAKIARFLRKKQLTTVLPQEWKSGVRGPQRSRLGKEAEAHTAHKLPSEEAMKALGTVFRLAREPRDIILTSTMALLNCAPGRVNEVFALPANYEVKETIDGKIAFGVRWAGSKKFPDNARFMISTFEDLAQVALARLFQHTIEARRISAHYEENPNQLYLPDDCTHLRGQNLKTIDVCKITGLRRNGVTSFLKRSHVKPVEIGKGRLGNRCYLFRFADVERVIVALLPRGFPILCRRTNLRYKDGLLVALRDEFHPSGSWRCMIAPVTYSNITSGFFNRPGNTNIFDRIGLQTKSGRVFITTHQIRHFLNNVANHSDVSQFDIAAWSGRADIQQNRTYDHETADSIVERRRQMERDLAVKRAAVADPSPPSVFKPAKPVSRSKAASLGIHGHVTEVGFCEHDFATSPCLFFTNCAHCTDNVCVKGLYPEHEKNIARNLTFAQTSLAKAQEAVELDYEGAADWVKSHTETVQRLTQLLAILTDPTVPDGTKIRLAKSGVFTLAEQALHDHDLVGGSQSHFPREDSDVQQIGTRSSDG